MRRDTNHNRKSSGRGHHIFNQQGNIVNTQHLQPGIQARLGESPRGLQSMPDGFRKKPKLEQHNFQANLAYNAQHQEYNQNTAIRPHDTPVFPGSGNKNINAGVKMELSTDGDPLHTQSSSPLPPFSQIRRQGSRPYSPGSAPFPDNLATPPHDDGRHNIAHDSSGDIKSEIEGAMHRTTEVPRPAKVAHSQIKHTKKHKG